MTINKKEPYTTYEYKVIKASQEKIYVKIDGYECFGWKLEEVSELSDSKSSARLKRDRKIINKVELTRLQNYFEACLEEIETLEKSKPSRATVMSLVTGVAGTAFISGSTFAVVHKPPLVAWCIILAIPGFILWISSYFVYRRILDIDTKRINQLINKKEEEMYKICEKAHSLL